MEAFNFEKAFQLQSNLLKGFAFNLTNDPIDAEDLFQDTAYLAFKNKHRFKEGTNLKAWLCTIMKNKFINQYRKKRRAGLTFDQTDDFSFVDSGVQSSENDGFSKISMQEVEEVIDSLDCGQKKPFTMAFEGFQYEEIANEMELPLGTVKSRIFLARKNLKQRLEVMNSIPKSLDFIAA